MEVNERDAEAWKAKSLALYIESSRLVMQAKAVMRAHEELGVASQQAMRNARTDDTDNPFSMLMKAVGVGVELKGDAFVAAYYDGMAHMRISQAAIVLSDLECLGDPAHMQESLEAGRLAFGELSDGRDLNELLESEAKAGGL